jgi:hypothetical protein
MWAESMSETYANLAAPRSPRGGTNCGPGALTSAGAQGACRSGSWERWRLVESSLLPHQLVEIRLFIEFDQRLLQLRVIGHGLAVRRPTRPRIFRLSRMHIAKRRGVGRRLLSGGQPRAWGSTGDGGVRGDAGYANTMHRWPVGQR